MSLKNWSAIPVPTLLIHGREDTFVPLKLGLAAQKEIPTSQITVVDGANHMLVLNNASRMIDEIKIFIK